MIGPKENCLHRKQTIKKFTLKESPAFLIRKCNGFTFIVRVYPDPAFKANGDPDPRFLMTKYLNILQLEKIKFFYQN